MAPFPPAVEPAALKPQDPYYHSGARVEGVGGISGGRIGSARRAGGRRFPGFQQADERLKERGVELMAGGCQLLSIQ